MTSFAFLQDVLDEVLGLFPSEFIHHQISSRSRPALHRGFAAAAPGIPADA